MTGELYINGVDAYDAWGISLEDGAISTLITPSATKDLVQNTSRLEHGKRVMTANVKMDSRDLTLEMHLCAKTKSDFFDKYNQFCTEILETGLVDIITCHQSDIEYHCIYNSCTQFGQYMFGLAKFSLKLTEYNPKDRTITHTIS